MLPNSPWPVLHVGALGRDAIGRVRCTRPRGGKHNKPWPQAWPSIATCDVANAPHAHRNDGLALIEGLSVSERQRLLFAAAAVEEFNVQSSQIYLDSLERTRRWRALEIVECQEGHLA